MPFNLRTYALAFVLLLPAGASGGITQQIDCLNNLSLLDGVKTVLEVDHKLKTGDVVTMDQLTNYISGGKIPVCKSGGTYTLGAIGVYPTCSIPGHSEAAFQRQIKLARQKELIAYAFIGAAALTVVIWLVRHFMGRPNR